MSQHPCPVTGFAFVRECALCLRYVTPGRHLEGLQNNNVGSGTGYQRLGIVSRPQSMGDRKHSVRGLTADHTAKHHQPREAPPPFPPP